MATTNEGRKQPIHVLNYGKLSAAIFFDSMENRYSVNVRRALSREAMERRNRDDYPPESILLHEEDVLALGKLAQMVSQFIESEKLGANPKL